MRWFLVLLTLVSGTAANAVSVSSPNIFVPFSGDAVMLAYLTGAIRSQTGDNANDVGTVAFRWRTGRFGTSAIIGTAGLNLTLGQSLFSSTGQDIIFSASTGFFRPNDDNLHDFGTVGNRLRTGRFGTSVVVGASTTLTDGTLATSALDLTINPFTNIMRGTANGVLQLGTAANAMSQLFLTTQLSVGNNAVTTTGFGSTTGSTTVSSAGGADVITFPSSNQVVPQNDNTTSVGSAAKRYATGNFGTNVKVTNAGNTTNMVSAAPAVAGDFRYNTATTFFEYLDGGAATKRFSPTSSVVMFSATTTDPAATIFIGVGTTDHLDNENLRWRMPIACTMANLFVRANTAPGAGQTSVLTVRKNAADTAITCTLSGAGGTTCSDTTNTVSFVAGDTLTLKCVNSAGTATANLTATLEIRP